MSWCPYTCVNVHHWLARNEFNSSYHFRHRIQWNRLYLSIDIKVGVCFPSKNFVGNCITSCVFFKFDPWLCAESVCSVGYCPDFRYCRYTCSTPRVLNIGMISVCGGGVCDVCCSICLHWFIEIRLIPEVTWGTALCCSDFMYSVPQKKSVMFWHSEILCRNECPSRVLHGIP
jgi:hypothetical protein